MCGFRTAAFPVLVRALAVGMIAICASSLSPLATADDLTPLKAADQPTATESLTDFEALANDPDGLVRDQALISLRRL